MMFKDGNNWWHWNVSGYFNIIIFEYYSKFDADARSIARDWIKILLGDAFVSYDWYTYQRFTRQKQSCFKYGENLKKIQR